MVCIQFQVNTLEQKKQVNLLGCMEEYWTSYSSFASAQSNILSQITIQKQNYAAPPEIQEYEAPQAYAEAEQGDDMKQDAIAEEESPPPPNDVAQGMAPTDDGQYEYYEEEVAAEDGGEYQANNAQTEDYNPFDE